jgi:hypothetical protein
VVEVEDLLAEVEVLERRRSSLSDPQRVLVVGDRHPLLRREDGSAVSDLMGLATFARIAIELVCHRILLRARNAASLPKA